MRPAETLALARDGGGWRLSGTAARVPWGASAGHVVVLAEGDGKQMVALVKGGAAKAERDVNLAQEPRDTLAWSGAPVLAAAAAGRADSRPTRSCSPAPWRAPRRWPAASSSCSRSRSST